MLAGGKVGEAAEGMGVALTAGGELLVKRGQGPTVRLALGAAPPSPIRLTSRVELVRQGGKEHRVLHVKATGEGQHLEAAVWLQGKRLTLIWAGTTGEHGDFGSWTRELLVAPGGLWVHQATRALSRCDGLPARMLSVGYHFAQGRLLPVLLQPPAKEGAVELVATTTAPSGVRPEPLAPFRFESSSSELGCQGEARQVTPPSEFHDGRLETAWVEGRGGPGRWEFVTARARGMVQPVRAVRILPGHGASMETAKAHNRLKRFWLLLGPKHRYRVTVPQDPASVAGVAGAPMAPWWVVLPAPVRSGCLTLVIEDVYPGTRDETAISEVAVFSALDFGDPLQSLMDAVIAGRMEREEAARTLVGLGPSALPALKRALGKAASEAEEEVLVRVLGTLDPRGSVNVLSKALRGAGVSLRAVLLESLKAAGDKGVPALAAVLGAKPTLELAREVAMVLAQVGTREAVDAVLGRLGVGSHELRRSLVAALAAFPLAHLRPVIWARLSGGEAPSALRGDLFRVLRALVVRHAELGPDATSLILKVMGRTKGFEARYRLLELMAQLGDARFAPFLGELLHGKEDPILREVAALALGRNQAPRRQAMLRRALKDPSPRVRRGAALAWSVDAKAKLAAANEALPDLLALVEGDPWSLVWEAAMGAISEACPPDAFPVLLRLGARPGSGHAAKSGKGALEGRGAKAGAGSGNKRGAQREASRNVGTMPRALALHLRRLALLSALRCRAPGTGQLLGSILRDDGDRLVMRALAVRLLAELGDRTEVPYLAEFLELLAREVKSARTRNELLAADIAAALGRLKDRRGLPALRQAAVVDRLPQLQASAVEALGGFCDAADQALVKAALGSKNRTVVGVASRVASRCGW